MTMFNFDMLRFFSCTSFFVMPFFFCHADEGGISIAYPIRSLVPRDDKVGMTKSG